ncbi:hypothetical protein I5R65_07660 [Herbaspirillum sp. AP02]|uniref:hypothetical protein n=1 Tax=unclassified Herbaspirillum TaxID=2624150 RepID=UPI0015D9AB91|nr:MULTISPECIES: hypothetical protein [unclassified Herbaspirillum]MBG7619336.1 hypothetical protein [Herbaspirillum sp. AP02]NZD66620.1 hypothetical protein [Herbaspirillum sp. AP21]
MAKTNVTKVQVPGEAAAPADDQSTALEQGAAGDDAGQDGEQIQAADDPAAGNSEGAGVADADALQAQLDAKDAELAELKAALAKADATKKPGPLRPGPGGRSDFTHVSASQIDVATLKRPIETRDGWLVPEKITQNDKG